MKKHSQQPMVNYSPTTETTEAKVTATVDVPITQATGGNLRSQIESWLLKDIADRHAPVQLAGFQVQDIMFNRATVSVTYLGNEAEVTEYVQQLGAPITNVGSRKIVGITSQRGWRQSLSAVDTPNKGFKLYKGDTQTFPGSAEFKGDEFPSKGDSAKKELEAWHEGNRLMQSDKRSDDSQTEHGSPLMSEKVKRYDVLKHNKEENVLPKYASKKTWRQKLSVQFGGDTGIDADYNPPKYDYIGEPVSYHGRGGVVETPEDEFGTVDIRFEDTGEVEAVDANELREQEFSPTPKLYGSLKRISEENSIVKCPFCGYAGIEDEFLPPNTVLEASAFYTCPVCGETVPSDADSTYPLTEDEDLFSSLKSWRERIAYITREDGGYMVHSETGKKLRKHPTTKEKAEKQLQAIEINKHKKGALKSRAFIPKGRNCDNCGRYLHEEDFIAPGSWSYTCPSCGFRYKHGGKLAEEQVEAFKQQGELNVGSSQKKADISFQNRPDGTVKIDVTSHPNEPLTQNPNTQQPAPLSPDQVQNQQTPVEETPEKKSALKKKISSEDYEALAKSYNVIFKGIQKDFRNPLNPGLPMFEDPATKSTFLLRPDETMSHAITRHEMSFQLHPKNPDFTTRSSQSQQITMPAKEFFEEHKRLLPILEHGTPEQRKEEADKQSKEVEEWKEKLDVKKENSMNRNIRASLKKKGTRPSIDLSLTKGERINTIEGEGIVDKLLDYGYGVMLDDGRYIEFGPEVKGRVGTGLLLINKLASLRKKSMGPYCKFCGNRCFTYFPEGTPEHILKAYGTATIIATCPEGQKFEKNKVGYCYDDILREIANKSNTTEKHSEILSNLRSTGEDLKRHIETTCSENPVESWTIRKDGNLELVGRQCQTHCGIFIIKDGKEIESNKLEKTANNLTWRELINQAEWEHKYEEYLKQRG